MRRRRRLAERVSHERWLVSYADFITLLFAFFTTLYAISTVDQHKAGKLVMSMMQALHVDFFPADDPGQGPSTPIARGSTRGLPATEEELEQARKAEDARREAEHLAKLRQLADEMQRFVASADLGAKVRVRTERRGVVLSLAEAGFFESGSARLMPGARAALEVVARRLGDRPDLAIMVEGNTDDVPVRGGAFASNWELSTGRATVVVAFLMDKGIGPRRLSAAGYAEHRPVADNATAEGRAHNRRVDLVLQEMPSAAATERIDVAPPTAAAPATSPPAAAAAPAPSAPPSAPAVASPARAAAGTSPAPSPATSAPRPAAPEPAPAPEASAPPTPTPAAAREADDVPAHEPPPTAAVSASSAAPPAAPPAPSPSSTATPSTPAGPVTPPAPHGVDQ